MKAAVCERYGSPDVLEVRDVEKPVPDDDQVLIRVRAAGLNPLDVKLMAGRPILARLFLGLRKPKLDRPGRDVAGEVEAVGRNITQFKPGDAVFGVCLAALSEYACAPERSLVTKPANLTFEQAASAPIAAFTAVQGLRDKGGICPGQKVLVNGASGGVGTFAVQIAKAFGAEVTGVCSTRNVDLVRSLGADHVVDYTREDFTSGDRRYDQVLDCVGNRSFSACRRVLESGGICVVVGAPRSLSALLANALGGLLLSRFVSQRYALLMAKRSKEDLALVRELMASGKVTPVLDGSYRLREVTAAFEHLAAGHARGKVVVTVANDVCKQIVPGV